MDIQIKFLEVIFQQVPYDEILGNDNSPGSPIIDEEFFTSFSEPYLNNRTTEEIQAIYNYMMNDQTLLPNLEHLSLIIDIANKVLTFNGNEIQCKYLDLLRWRKLSFSLGDDIFTTAFLAYQDYIHSNESSFYAWSSIISTDNTRLKTILKQGLAENHNHLNGSTQIFPVSWASLMNHVTGRSQDFKNFERILHPKANNLNKSKKNLTLHNQCLLAADIRVNLFEQIQSRKPDEKESRRYKNILAIGSYLEVDELQMKINHAKTCYGGQTSFGQLDYALTDKLLLTNNNNNRLLVGERYFLYQCFRKLLSGEFGRKELQLFYTYLLLKNNFRQELIQTNELVGFSNFKAYQDRKNDFVNGHKYQQYNHEQVRLALNSPIEEQEIHSFETRIGPKEYGCDMNSYLKEYEEAYYYTDEAADPMEYLTHSVKNERNEKEKNSKHFYVLHFPKCGKKKLTGGLDDYIYCRDYEIRQRVKRQTNGILELLQTNSRESRLVKGIDTCSTEIDYRPEIFGEAFRRLRNHYQTNSLKKLVGLDKEELGQQLRATNHSGEDFMDLLDGLRAIDETIQFCEFVRGDRLGHALALGLDAKDFYNFKLSTIISTKQDTLDDISWGIYKSNILGVPIDSTLRAKLKEEAMKLLLELYGAEVNLHDYQQAWLLRGDSPELYIDEITETAILSANSLSYSEQYLTIPKFERGVAADKIRENKNYSNIYRSYHFDGQVKFKGQKKYVRKISDAEVRWITRLQDAMQNELMEKGIAVECNPSSNYLISSFKRYEKHPIFRFNSTGLKECLSPLSVSINTDDQGVFDTSLENEYALLAISLEKAKDEDGNRLYTPESIYNWLDYVRRLGLQQSFK